ncbi:MAG: DUF6657 family protein [Dehalogenimonas sp.]|uniref:DUF6657 family protein n=1 Tax=Candidatus Dehalogenimonas loeffleri TaxID=3127115 RepID=A0ABZ2J7Z8_9CHLR|nr:DUF6657 family protein [Dehalogenimonas sp.]
MDFMRSAKDIALDKVKEIEEITPEDRLRWKYVPLGEKLAHKYLAEDLDLEEELAAYQPEEAAFVKLGLTPVLLAALDVPRDEAAAEKSHKIMGALMLIKNDQETVAGLLGQLQQIFEHYTGPGEQQKQQAFQQFKTRFEQRIRQTMREQQGVDYPGQINVEQYPQFKEEWRRNLTQFDRQYLNSIDQLKKELAAVA